MLDQQTLSDRIEIADLLTRYTRAIDTLNFDLLDDVFLPDAHVDYTATGGIAASYPEAKAWLAETLGMFSAMQHTLGQLEVTLDGDKARVRAYLFNVLQIAQPDGGVWQMDIGCYYLHELVRTPSGWRSAKLEEELAWQRTS